MSNDQITDLKSYIATTVHETVHDAVSQSETRLTNRMDEGFAEMRDGFSGVAEAIEQINHRLDNARIAI